MNVTNQTDKDMTLPETEKSLVPVTPQLPAQDDSSAHPPAAAREDRDIIDPAWLGKVEQIFRTQADDPYAMTEQFGNLKAEYIAQQFGKSVKKANE